jgi:mannosyltransferase OCH1-like enzyme
MWAYISDYVRIKTLYDNEVIYLDVDVSVVKSLDDCPDNPAFAGIQDNKADGGKENLVELAILGVEKGNKFIKKVLSFYEGDIWKERIFLVADTVSHFPRSLR